MAKLTLNDITSGAGSAGLHNSNNDLIEAAIENTLSLDGTAPNQMEANLDMNSNRIINVAEPVADSDGATKGYVDDVAASITAGSGGGEGGVTDHGLLLGLGDDDHSQYYNESRLATYLGTYTGLDSRYYTESELDVLFDTHTHTASTIDSGAATDGYVLTADGAGNAAWEAVPAAGGAVAALDDVGDVTITANSAGEILKWNGSAWINNTLTEAAILGLAGGTLTGTLNSRSVIPTADSTYALGSATYAFSASYVDSYEFGQTTDTSMTRLAAGKVGVEGKAVIKHTGSYTSGEVTFSTLDPSGGSSGDIWFKYTA